MRPRRHLRRSGGMSLIEVLIASGMIVVVSVSVFSGIRSGVRAAQHARDAVMIDGLVRGLVSGLEAGGFARLRSDRGRFGAQGRPDVEWSLDVPRDDSAPCRDYRLTVSWMVGSTPRVLVLDGALASRSAGAARVGR